MRILVADDHSLFRDGIIGLLEADGYEVVGQVGDGQTAIEAALRLKPDLVLMDIYMPIKNGLEALSEIKAKLPSTRVVMLTVSDEDVDLFTAIKGKADGYLLKSMNGERFLDRLHGLEKGEMAISRLMATHVITAIAASEHRGKKGVGTLTQREYEVLRLTVDGLSNKAIAQRLVVSENTVKYHLKKIMAKLNVQSRAEAVAYAVRTGMYRPPETS